MWTPYLRPAAATHGADLTVTQDTISSFSAVLFVHPRSVFRSILHHQVCSRTKPKIVLFASTDFAIGVLLIRCGSQIDTDFCPGL
jgi:hypothetical protein